jgi:hypothetical protein
LYSGQYYPSYYGNNFANYEDSAQFINGTDITFRYNYFVGTPPASYPLRGGILGVENLHGYTGFEDVLYGTIQLKLFGMYNDTTRSLDLTQGKDDLGLKNLADYQQFNHPTLLPPSGSPLLTGAMFPGKSPVDIPQFNKDIIYVGAFGAQDWTQGWTNFNPQQTQY